MPAITESNSSKPFQAYLVTPEGRKSLPESFSRCPKCRKRGKHPVLRTLNPEDVRVRRRICEHCGFQFETEMQIPDNCPQCRTFNPWRSKDTRRIHGGILRLYQCTCCGTYLKTMEKYPPAEVQTLL